MNISIFRRETTSMQKRGSADGSDRRLRSATRAARQASPPALPSHDAATAAAQQRRQTAKAKKRAAAAPTTTDPTLGDGRLTVAERDALLAYYYDVDQPHALTSSARHLYKSMKQRVPSLTLDKCRFFLQSQPPYTLTAPRRAPVPSNPMEVYRCYELLACDIMVLRQYSDRADSLLYCLIVVDVFSPAMPPRPGREHFPSETATFFLIFSNPYFRPGRLFF